MGDANDLPLEKYCLEIISDVKDTLKRRTVLGAHHKRLSKTADGVIVKPKPVLRLSDKYCVCGNQLAVDALFCRKCGRSAKQASSQPPSLLESNSETYSGRVTYFV